jgi:hypothetical protein
MTARAFFIASSGRSGTAMLQKALSAEADIEMHHEFAVHTIQPLAVKRYLGLIDSREATRTLNEVYGAAIAASSRRLWGDSSNKISWLIPELAALLPDAKFIHLVRDGRKVASSYFHKLADECYDDCSNALMQAHYDGLEPAPPPEKKYWWPVPRRSDPLAKDFQTYKQFQRVTWHWAEINRVIAASLAMLASERTLFVRLEDLRSQPSTVRSLYEFLGLHFRDEHFAAFARPHNVNRPQDKLLTPMQREEFDAIASEVMTRFGYAGSEEYVVNY